MAIRDIFKIPHPIFKQIAKPVPVIDNTTRVLARDLLDTIYAASGIGLTAVHIGVLQQIIAIDLRSKAEPKQPMIFINPEIIWLSDERLTYNEGSLSMPGVYIDIERPARIRLRYLDENSKCCELEADGLLATCLQHEIDQLNGIMFLDHLSKLKRDRILKKTRQINQI
jgi:peptide deformylase